MPSIQNDFLQFAYSSSASVTPQSTWVGEPTFLANGVQAGIADNLSANKLWRQSATWGNVLASLINEKTGFNTIDDGTTSALLAGLSQSMMVNANLVDSSSVVNVLTAAFTPAISSLIDGMIVQIKPAQTNTSSVTLNVNGINPYPIHSVTGALIGGELIAGRTYTLQWNSGSSTWTLLNSNISVSTPSLSDNSTNIATTAFVKGQNYITATSPALTGTPTAPTPGTGDNSTNIATTAFVKNQGYATLASPTFTGTVTVPTPSVGDNSTKAASTAYVENAGFALLSSPALTGVPTAPTASTGTNTTQIATTAFVYSAIGGLPASIIKMQRNSFGFSVLTSNNKILTWGDNTNGQLGTGYAAGNGLSGEVQFPSNEIGGSILQYEVIDQTSYCLWSSGNLYAWGYNGYGQFGNGNTTSTQYPVLVQTNVQGIYAPSNSRSYEASTAVNTSIFIKLNSGVFQCTGRNNSGQLGLGSISTPNTTDQHTWTNMIPPSGKTIMKIFPGSSPNGSTFIQTTDLNVYGTGYNANGQIGDGTTTSKSYWVNLPTLNGLTIIDMQNSGYDDSVPANYQSSVCITSTSCYTAGYNGQGQLGIGSTTSSSSWNIAYTPSGKTITSLKKLNLSVYLILSDSTYVRWGYNGYGQLGLGNTTNQTSPVTSTSGDPGGATVTNIFATTGSGGGTRSAEVWLLKPTGLYFCGYNGSGSSGIYTSLNLGITTQTLVNINNLNIQDIKRSGNGSTSSACIIFNNTSEVYTSGYNTSYEQNTTDGTSKYCFSDARIISNYL